MLARRDDRPDHPGRVLEGMPPTGLGSALRGLALALQFLTVLPVLPPRHREAGQNGEAQPQMAAALPWFPLVGVLIGGTLALVDWTARPVLSLGERSVVVLAVSAGITGMLHLDGFIDCCDALLGTRSIERRLDILRDSRVGAYGVIGGALLLLLSYAALVALSQPQMRLFALLSAPLLGRVSMVYAVVRYPYARASGVGSPFRASGRHLAWTVVFAGVLLIVVSLVSGEASLIVALVRAALAAAAALVVMVGVPSWMSRRLGGGLTGDTYGALNECVEVAILIVVPLIFAATVHLH